MWLPHLPTVFAAFGNSVIFSYLFNQQVSSWVQSYNAMQIHQVKCLLKESSWFRNQSCIWQNGYGKLSFESVCCCIKQGSHYEFLQLLEKEFTCKHEFQNLTIMLLLKIKAIFLANILVMKEDRFSTARVHSCFVLLLDMLLVT